MEKEYLGLGVVFNALDKGFTNSVEGIKKALLGANDAMVSATKLAGGGIFKGIGDGLKTLSLAKIGSAISDIESGVNGTGHGIDEMAKSLDFTRAKMTAALDPKTAARFSSQMIGVAASSALTGDQVDVISHNLLNSGVAIDKMGESLPMIGTLVGKLGMDAGTVSTMFGEMQGYLGMSSKDAMGLTKEIFKLQKEYKLTNLMESLPEITENVNSNMIRLGQSSPIIANRMVQDVMKMTASFEKMGMSQSKATKMATGFNDTLGDVREAFLDLRAGLDPQSNIIQELIDAFGKGGLNATGLIASIRDGKKSNEQIMLEMQDMIAKLPEQQKLNVMQSLKRTSLGKDIANVLDPLREKSKEINAEAAKQAGKVGTAESAFDSFKHQLNGTLKVQDDVNKAAKALTDTMAALMDKAGISKALEASTKKWNEMSSAITDTDSVMGKVLRTAYGLKAVGLGYLFPDAGATGQVITHAIGGIVFQLTALFGIAQILMGPLKWFKNFFVALLPTATGAAGAVAEVGVAAEGAVGAMEGLAVAGAGVNFTGATNAVMAVEGIGAAAEGAAGAVGGVGLAAEAAGGGLLALLGPIGLVIAAVVAIGAAVAAVVYFWDDLTKAVTFFDADAGQTMKDFRKTMIELWAVVKTKFWAAWGDIVGAFKEFGPLALPIIKQIGTAIVRMFSLSIEITKVYGAVTAGVIYGILKIYQYTFGLMVDTVKFFYDYYTDIWNKNEKTIMEWVNSVTGFFTDLKNVFIKMWTECFTWWSDAIKGALAWLVNASPFKGIIAEGEKMFANFWKNNLEKPLEEAEAGILKIFQRISDALPQFLKTDLVGLSNAVMHPLDTAKHYLGMDTVSATGTTSTDAATVLAGATPKPPKPTDASSVLSTVVAATPAPGVSTDKGGTPMNPATPVKGQEGAPSMSNMAGVDLTPTFVPTLDDKNFQAMIQMMADTKDAIVRAIAGSNTSVEVVLQGDARKFLNVMKQDAKNKAGAAGMNPSFGG